MKIADFQNQVAEMLEGTGKTPVVVFTAVWPFLRALQAEAREVPRLLLESIQEVVGKDRNLVMPTFTHGYKDGLCNLDKEPSSTGMVSELMRGLPGSVRNLTAFFPYSIIGPDAEEFAALLPEHAWGDGSAYEWMELKNASFLMLGTHPTHCSYLHRMEWLAREKINYRYVKTFKGKIIRNGQEHDMVENLYVRCLEPAMINDFTKIYDHLVNNGMNVVKLEGIHLAHMTAADMKDAYLPALLKDPYISVKNREDFEKNDSAYHKARN
jgi:aminoglycoside 3-N-acetyltransferase